MAYIKKRDEPTLTLTDQWMHNPKAICWEHNYHQIPTLSVSLRVMFVGTHWVWELCNMLLQGSAEYHESTKEVQMLELTGSRGSEDLPSPRVFNTHLLFRQLPRSMISRKCKMIYVTRNPKDMAVSRYVHNQKGCVGYKGTFSDYLSLYLDGKSKIYYKCLQYLVKFNRHCTSWVSKECQYFPSTN